MLKEIKEKVLKSGEKKNIPTRIYEEQQRRRTKKIKNTLVIILIILVWIFLFKLIFDQFAVKKVNEIVLEKSKSNISSNPIQRDLREQETIEFKGVEITKLAEYDITGMVLGREFYYFGGGANTISPEDLVLGWGPAAQERYIGDIGVVSIVNDRYTNLTFQGEYYEKFGEESGNYISNNHIIPMNNQVNTVLKKAKEGDIVKIVGWLVYCKGDNWTWGPSSMTRTDTGGRSMRNYLSRRDVYS